MINTEVVEQQTLLTIAAAIEIYYKEEVGRILHKLCKKPRLSGNPA